MLTVACVFNGGRYDRNWVRKLERGVKRHLNVAHRFVCFTSLPIPGIDTVPLAQGWPGWWAKLEMFGCLRHALYLDLDVLVLRDIAALTTPTKFTMWREPQRDLPNSSVMFWNEDLSGLFHKFSDDAGKYIQAYGGDQWPSYSRFGDQAFIADNTSAEFWREPFQTFSFDGRPTLDEPGDALLSICLGEPKFDAYPDMNLVKQNWI